MDNLNSKYGYFDLSYEGKYVITNPRELTSSWEYILQNQQMLLYVDQNGPIRAQINPPAGILIFKRNDGEKNSKWHTFFVCHEINGGQPFSNFGKGITDSNFCGMRVEFMPESAVYICEIEGIRIVTRLSVPIQGCAILCSIEVQNESKRAVELKVVSSVFPYLNEPLMVPWDKPEWYLGIKPKRDGSRFCFCAKTSDSLCRNEMENNLLFSADYDENAGYILNMEEYCGNGDFYSPNKLFGGDFGIKFRDCRNERFWDHPAVIAVCYNITIHSGGGKVFKQAMERTEEGELNPKLTSKFFSEGGEDEFLQQSRNFYSELFNKFRLETKDKVLNGYVNSFLPLQLYWVSSLDRGWPTGMRGVRDCSNDFMAMNMLDSDAARKVMLSMLCSQRSDGWFPRQVSSVPGGKNDMRFFADSGAFFLEFFHEYLKFTKDESLLAEKCRWLDDEREDTVLCHILRCLDFFLDEKNIGEHGLCKAYYGDWWDVMDRIGMEGRGESVTVTFQLVHVLEDMCSFFEWAESRSIKIKDLEAKKQNYISKINCFKAALDSAYNREGYFAGYFNDSGKWIMSDSEQDGINRFFLVPNSWALISEIAESRTDSIIKNADKYNLTSMGHLLYNAHYSVPIENAGRVGRGMNYPIIYNHAQAFWARGLLKAGYGNKAMEVMQNILPYNHSCELTHTPPYAIVNGYSIYPVQIKGRGGFQFLTGTTAMLFRLIFNYLAGLEFTYSGIKISRTNADILSDAELSVSYLSYKIKVLYKKCGSFSVWVNGKVDCGRDDIVLVPDGALSEGTVIEVRF